MSTGKLLIAALLPVTLLAQEPENFDRALAGYLRLSPEQIREISGNDKRHNSAMSPKQARHMELLREVQEAQSALEIGTRLAEIESMRREMEASAVATRQRNRALMTAEQRTRLDRLDSARPLLEVLHHAICAGLSRGPARDPSDRPYFCAQMGAAFLLRMYLGLTASQVAAIDDVAAEVSRNQNEAYARLNRLRSDEATQTARTPIDPVALGSIHLEIRRTRLEIDEARPVFRERLRLLLTPAQEVSLKNAEQEAPLQPLLSPAECEGLIARPRRPFEQPPSGGNFTWEFLFCASS